MRNIAIIPARSGSKGIKDKNIKDLCGKPLIAYTIQAAISSGKFDEVKVSTDSEHYADIARQYGANVPFLRTESTATDEASSQDVIEEVLGNYMMRGDIFDTFCLLQPTSPLRTFYDIFEAYRLYKDKAKFAVVSVCEAEHSPRWCGHLPEDGELIGFLSEQNLQQRQSGQTFYRLNGAIYIVNVKRYLKDRFLYQKGSYAYIMPQERSVDLDTEFDFKLIEFMLNNNGI